MQLRAQLRWAQCNDPILFDFLGPNQVSTATFIVSFLLDFDLFRYIHLTASQPSEPPFHGVSRSGVAESENPDTLTVSDRYPVEASSLIISIWWPAIRPVRSFFFSIGSCRPVSGGSNGRRARNTGGGGQPGPVWEGRADPGYHWTISQLIKPHRMEVRGFGQIITWYITAFIIRRP